jgi:HD domain-containing protein
VHLVCVEDQVYINDVRIRVQPHEQEVLSGLIEELERHEIGGISFHAALTPPQLRSLARLLSAPPGTSGRARAALAGQLAEAGDVELGGRYRFRVKGERPRTFLEHGEIQRRGAVVLRDTLRSLAAHRVPNPLPIRRVVIDLVDSLKADPAHAAAVPLRRPGRGPGEQHLLSVCSLSIQLGQALGLSDAALSDLGVTAMLHDVGRVQESDRNRHGAAGARILLHQRGFHEGKMRRLRAVFEHHQPIAERPSLFARILHIADDYDVLIAPRPGLPQIPPATAQASMWAARGTEYDPDLMALFVQTMGLYPPGSLLELSDGCWAVTVSVGRGPERFAWPRVRIVSRSDVTTVAEEVDLYECRDRLRPRRVVNPASQGVDVAQLLEAVFSAA